MTAASIASFANQVATSRRAAFGVAVTFRGETFMASVDRAPDPLSLSDGGLGAGETIRLRLPSTISPAPGYLGRQTSRGGSIVPEEIRLDDRAYYVTACEPADGLAHPDHYVTASSARS
jgi:hypothetical protein